MSIRKDDGFVSIEGLTCLIFLMIICIFAWRMWEQQKDIIIKANQDVEVTRILFDIRQALKGDSCRENFLGLNINTNKGLIKEIKVLTSHDHVETIYKTSEKLDVLRSSLRLSSYELLSRGDEKKKGLIYLKVNFDRGSSLGMISREIKLFIKEKDFKIIECSLNPILEKSLFWKKSEGGISSEFMYHQIKSNKKIGTLNLKGGLFVEESIVTCNDSQWGSISWNDSEGRWKLCSKAGASLLSDDRIFSEESLLQMVDNEKK